MGFILQKLRPYVIISTHAPDVFGKTLTANKMYHCTLPLGNKVVLSSVDDSNYMLLKHMFGKSALSDTLYDTKGIDALGKFDQHVRFDKLLSNGYDASDAQVSALLGSQPLIQYTPPSFVNQLVSNLYETTTSLQNLIYASLDEAVLSIELKKLKSLHNP